MDAMDRVVATAEDEVDCLAFSDSIGLFAILFFVISMVTQHDPHPWAVKNCVATKQDLRQIYKALTNCTA